jgi:hypothetical protein
MTIDQALQLIAALIQAVIKAIETGEPNVDLLSALQYADDAARADLEQALEIAKEVVG